MGVGRGSGRMRARIVSGSFLYLGWSLWFLGLREVSSLEGFWEGVEREKGCDEVIWL